MPLEEINIGSAINAGDGEAIRNAFAKVNAMLAEIYGFLAPNGFNPDFLASNSLVNGKLATMPPNSVKANLTGSPASPDNVGYAALKTALGIAPNVSALAAAYTVIATDIGKVFTLTNSWTLALTAAATLGNGFSFYVKNLGTGIVTIDPATTEQIDGKATITIPPKSEALVVCDGANWRTFGLVSRVLLDADVKAAVANVDLALLDGYASYELILRNFDPVTLAASLIGRFSLDNGATYLAGTSYLNAGLGVDQAGGGYNVGSGAGGANAMALTYQQNNVALYSNAAAIKIFPGTATRGASITHETTHVNSSNRGAIQSVGNILVMAGRATNIRLLYSTGNIANLSYELYGLRN